MSFCIIFACFIVYFIVHAAFVRIKLMTMMIIRSMLSLGFPVVMLCVRGMLMSLPVRAYLSANVWRLNSVSRRIEWILTIIHTNSEQIISVTA